MLLTYHTTTAPTSPLGANPISSHYVTAKCNHKKSPSDEEPCIHSTTTPATMSPAVGRSTVLNTIIDTLTEP